VQPKKYNTWLKPNAGHAYWGQQYGVRKAKQDGALSLRGPALLCKNLEDWLRPHSNHYRAMCVPRHQIWSDIQRHVDALAESGAFGETEALMEIVQIPQGKDAQQHLAAGLAQKAQRIAAAAINAGLPAEIGYQIEDDFMQIGMVVARMAPATRMNLTLNVVGTNSCSRWHQDQYTGRAVVSYNSCSTECIDHAHVDFKGPRTSVRDYSQVLYPDLGDILFMKGTKFPTSANGLVHKSPETRFHADGRVMHRLLLKIDLP
jgi:hypothetical protein